MAATADAIAGTTTTTTTYEYNADGALTRVTKQVDGDAPVETYLVWDNFVPEADDPTTGALSMANGNLHGYGPAPNTLETLFEFDRRDRLTAYVSGSESVSYSYDAMSLMATAETPEERIHFYYDNSTSAQAVNMRAEASGLASRKLGPFYDLSDGTEQLLIRPDKDVAGVYDPAADGFSAYEYDAYGGQTDGGGQALDLRRNPFQYAGEYRDSVSGLTYLRARWYDPDFPTFLSRDPLDTISRYGYGDGDPRNRVDPSGRKSHWWRNWNRGGAKFMRALEGGAGARGAIERTLLGGPLGLVGMIAEPKGMVKMATKDGGWGSAVLVGGIVAEVVLDRASPFNSYLKNYVSRVLLDFGVGIGQSVFMAREHGHFNKKSFFEGVQLTVGAVGFGRVFAARGYKPFNLTLDDVERMRQALTSSDDVLVFKMKTGMNPSFRLRWDSPLGDVGNLGWYHEVLVGVSKDEIFFNEFGSGGGLLRQYSIVGRNFTKDGFESALDRSGRRLDKGWGTKSKWYKSDQHLRFMGRFTGESRAYYDVNVSNPLQVRFRPSDGLQGRPTPYNFFWLNCQDHVDAVLNQMTLQK